MVRDEIGYAALDMRNVSAAELVRMAAPGAPMELFNTGGWGYLTDLRTALVRWIERERRLPVDGEPDEIVEAFVAATGERRLWDVFLGMTGWLLVDAEGRRLSTDGVRRTLESVGRRMVRGLLERASARLG